MRREFQLHSYAKTPQQISAAALNGKKGLQAAACISEGLAGPSWLVLVQHGVTLEPVKLMDDFGCLVVMDACGLPKDLSSLVAINGPELKQRMEWAKNHLRDLLVLVETELEQVSELAGGWGGFIHLGNLAEQLLWLMAGVSTLGIAWAFYCPTPIFDKVQQGMPFRKHRTINRIRARLAELRFALFQSS